MSAERRLLRNLGLASNIAFTLFAVLTYGVGPSRKFMLIAAGVYWPVALLILIRRWNTMTLAHLSFLLFAQTMLSVVLAGLFSRWVFPAAQ